MRVGVTGAIGSGKTFFASALSEDPRIRRLDADRIGHEALQPGSSLLPRIIAQFGRKILDRSGGVDRRRLAAEVFSRPARVEELNAIVHPWLLATLKRRITRLNHRPGIDIVVLDAALLCESGIASMMDRVVVLEAAEAKRHLWLEERGYSLTQILGRESAQWTPEKKKQLADIVVKNDGTEKDLQFQAHRLARIWLRALQTRE